jgi:hypothetical protein
MRHPHWALLCKARDLCNGTATVSGMAAMRAVVNNDDSAMPWVDIDSGRYGIRIEERHPSEFHPVTLKRYFIAERYEVIAGGGRVPDEVDAIEIGQASTAQKAVALVAATLVKEYVAEAFDLCEQMDEGG